MDPKTNGPVVATVADVMRLLQQCPPNAPVACARDATGNMIAALMFLGIEELAYAGDRHFCDDGHLLKPVVVLYPAHQ